IRADMLSRAPSITKSPHCGMCTRASRRMEPARRLRPPCISRAADVQLRGLPGNGNVDPSRGAPMWKQAVDLTLAAWVAVACTPGAIARGTFPDRPIKFVVPYGPGGTVDPTARLLASRASEILGQPVVVENKAGAAGSIGTEYVVRAPADGYTVLVHTNVI